ncbi:MAG TPA: hypothetical protein PLQ01_10680, partial [Methanothrix sp.]|nr:hypothetical protein [Methanothrix sp.]
RPEGLEDARRTCNLIVIGEALARGALDGGAGVRAQDRDEPCPGESRRHSCFPERQPGDLQEC